MKQIVKKKRYRYLYMEVSIGVPPNHPFWIGIFHYKPSSYWGIPMCANPHMDPLNPYGLFEMDIPNMTWMI